MIRQLAIGVMLLFTVFNSNAQLYPVQTTVVTTPPYYNYLAHYGDMNNHLQIVATFTDFLSPPITARLRLTIDGPGYVLRTRQDIPSGLPFVLSPGVPVFIQGSDLLPYLSENSLELVSGNVDLENLPEGFTTICVEVVKDGSGAEVVSNKACTAFFLQYMQPPQALLPLCNAVVDTASLFQTFQWSPPQNYLPTAGSDLTYNFSLYEWIDTTNYNIFQTGQGLVYQAQTSFPMAQVSNFDVLWQNGRKYIWRVQAQLTNNGLPVQLFTQNGISAPCSFYYGKSQSLAQSLTGGLTIHVTAQALASRKGRALWTVTDQTPGEGLSAYNAYIVEYRRKPYEGENYQYNWLCDTVYGSQQPIWRLEPEKTYQVRVRGVAGDFVSEPSDIVEFTTPPLRDYACGEADMPYVPVNYSPLANANMGDVFQIGQFELEVTHIEPLGLPGHFRGRGLIKHDFIGGAKVRVRFDDLLVDNQFVVRQGMATAVTDGAENWLNEEYLDLANPIPVDGVIESGDFVNDSTVFVVVNGDSLFFTFSGSDLPIVIHGDNNVEYQFWPNGTMIVTTYGITASTDQLDATARLHFRFEEASDQPFGFDSRQYSQFNDNYELIVCQQQFIYHVPHQSKSTTGTALVKAVLHGTIPNFLPSQLTFELAGGHTMVPSTKLNDSTYQLTLPERSYDYSVYAIYSDLKLGKLNVKSYVPLTKKVTVVPLVSLNGITETQIEAGLNGIFKGANLTIDVTIAPQFNTPEFTTSIEFANPEVSVMAKYTTQMRALRDAYLAAHEIENGAYLVFVIPGFEDENIDGYMVRGRGLGFVTQSTFSGATAFSRTLAHELGHGMGGLQHVWGDNESLKGTTNNLMDYAGGNQLIKNQWEALQDPGVVVSLLDGEEDFMAESANKTFSKNNLPAINNNFLIPIQNIPSDAVFRTENGFYVQFPSGTRSRFTHFVLENGLLTGLRNNDEAFPLVTSHYTFSTVYNPNTTENDTIAWESSAAIFVCKDCVRGSRKTTLQNGDTLTTYKFIEADIRIPNDQILACEDVAEFINGYSNGTIQFQTPSCQQASEIECNTEFITEIEQQHVQQITQKLSQIVTQASGNVSYNPFRRIGDDNFLTARDSAVINEKVKALRQLRPNTVVAYIFLENDGNYLYSSSDLKTIAQNAVNSVAQNHPTKEIALFLMNYSRMEQHGLLQISNKSCMTMTFATNQADFISPGFLPADLSAAKDLYNSMLLFYSKLKKPYYKFNIYEKYDGSLAIHQIVKTANPAEDVYGLPFVRSAEHLVSKKLQEYNLYQEEMQEILAEYEAELEDHELSLEDLAEWQQLQSEYLPLLGQWKTEQLNDPNDWQHGNVPFDNIRESILDSTIALAEFKKESGNVTFFIDLAILQYGNAGVLNQNVYYEFNVMDRIVDPVIYGTIDVLGCIPGVDFFADGAGMLYATARGDGQEMVVYTAALATPFIGAAIYHSGQKMVSYYAKQTAEGVFEIQAKLLEENLQGWVKISDDIPIANQNVSSKLDELNSPTALNAFDEETVEVLVKVRKVSGIITTATKAITKSRLPNEFIDALKTFGKSEDEILTYFTDYHNLRSNNQFFNEIEEYITSMNSHNLTRAEAFSLWGYTTNFFYRDLNTWLRKGENILETTELKNLINSGLSKLPNYSGQNVYRGIVIEAEHLQTFLNSYNSGTNHSWGDFTSCGGSQAASFGGRPEVNIIFEIQHTTGKEISDLADGIKYGIPAMPKPEILIKAGSKFEVVANPTFDGILGKWKIKLVQIQ